MIVLNWAVFGETSPVNSRAHLPAQGEDKHFLLAAKCKLQSKFESSEHILLFSLLTRLDESNLHRGCLIGQGAHLWAALAEGTESGLVHFVWRLAPSPRERESCFTCSAPIPHITKVLWGNLIKWLFWVNSEQLAPYFISQHKLFGFLIILQGNVHCLLTAPENMEGLLPAAEIPWETNISHCTLPEPCEEGSEDRYIPLLPPTPTPEKPLRIGTLRIVHQMNCH